MIKGLAAAAINADFLSHVAEHGLMYATTEEFQFRQDIFLKNDATYKQINANPENTFEVGHNFMSTWTDEEYRAQLVERPETE